nr:uncharacterized protein LOC109229625 [Ipomoea batatas]GMD47799.1 uncharacterized protein LOC109229625 [Ipomoea batatas]
MGYDAAEEEQWRVGRVYAAEEDTMIVKVRSPTSEMYPEVKETDKVRDLANIIEQAWGNDPMILRHNGVEMQSDQPLSVYNVRDGSVVKVSVLAEPPHYPQPTLVLRLKVVLFLDPIRITEEDHFDQMFQSLFSERTDIGWGDSSKKDPNNLESSASNIASFEAHKASCARATTLHGSSLIKSTALLGKDKDFVVIYADTCPFASKDGNLTITTKNTAQEVRKNSI